MEDKIEEIRIYIEKRLEVLSEGQFVRENGIAIRELYVLRDKMIPVFTNVSQLITPQEEEDREGTLAENLRDVVIRWGVPKDKVPDCVDNLLRLLASGEAVERFVAWYNRQSENTPMKPKAIPDYITEQFLKGNDE